MTNTIWTQTFALLCLAQWLAYAQSALLTPTIPLYVSHLGGSPVVVGLVLASFAATSVIFRPLIGSWADSWSEAGVLAWGCALMSVSLLLFFVPRPESAMVANAVRGVGWAALNTGGYALLALAAPAMRRAEASGYYSGVQASASIIFPAVALWLIDAPLGGFASVIVFAATLAIAAALLGFYLGRGAPARPAETDARSDGLRLNPFALVEREVLLPSALLFCLNLGYPAVSGFLVLYARELGITNIGWYFVLSGSMSLLARPGLGRLADRIGYGPAVAIGFALEIASFLLLAAASSLGWLLIAGTLFALGNAIASSTILALAIQRANPRRRGRAMASFSVAYPLAAGVGALLSGMAVELAGYQAMYLTAAAMGAAGLLVTAAAWSTLAESR